MSTVEYTASSEVGIVSLPRRISELMHEKGDAFSIRAFAERIGISRETLRLSLIGERPISPSTLEKIAQGLGLTVERVRQMDTVKQSQELAKLLNGKNRTKIMMVRANSYATELVDVAKGVTERGFALNNLGRVQFLLEQYEHAHETWKRALVFAKQAQEFYDDKRLLHLVTANLMLSYTIRKEYSNIDEVLIVVEQAFPANPQMLGMGYYTRMKVQEDRGDLNQAREHAYRSLEYFEMTDNGNHIGKALLNAAHYEFVLGNYEVSAKLLSTAIEHVTAYEDLLVRVVKNYVKSLMKLKEFDSAIRIIKEYIEIAKEYPEYWARLQIMYTVAKDDPSFADAVINNSSLSSTVRRIASKCLTEYYYLKGDAEKSMGYYEKVRIFSRTEREYLDEEEL